MPAYRAVLFDFFGTLTRSVQRSSAHTTVADLLGCPADLLADLLDRSYYLRASGRLGNPEDTLRWVCEQAGAYPSAAELRAAVNARRAAVASDTRLRPDAVTALRGLRDRGVRTALVSDCTHELPAVLPKLAVAPLLDVWVYSVEVGRCKPDPAMYLTACGRLGVAPDDCLYVGDGGSQELSGAQRTGMTAVQLAAPDLAGHLAFNVDRSWQGRVLHSLSEVVDLVDHTPELV
ncbi:HAD family hydrolase [Micromonospora sp. CPCC 206060]|uniref:HAD family hydrolase n=1 Tax=Micromonospora sp. CPCC 206060 TaxID=3122406 RepID=UPI002FEFADEF